MGPEWFRFRQPLECDQLNWGILDLGKQVLISRRMKFPDREQFLPCPH